MPDSDPVVRPGGLLVRIKARLLLVRLSCLLVALVVGAAAFGMAADRPARSALSYVGGLVLVAAAFEFGKFNIRLVSSLMPTLSLAMALFSYVLTVLALGLVLAASSPRVVDGKAVAVGLLIGVSIWLASDIAEAWVVQEHP